MTTERNQIATYGDKNASTYVQDKNDIHDFGGGFMVGFQLGLVVGIFSILLCLRKALHSLPNNRDVGRDDSAAPKQSTD
jgi:hypothetical protein